MRRDLEERETDDELDITDRELDYGIWDDLRDK